MISGSSSTKLLENNKPFLVVNKFDVDFYYFIKIPMPKKNVSSIFRLIIVQNIAKIPINTLNKSFHDAHIFLSENYGNPADLTWGQVHQVTCLAY